MVDVVVDVVADVVVDVVAVVVVVVDVGDVVVVEAVNVALDADVLFAAPVLSVPFSSCLRFLLLAT